MKDEIKEILDYLNRFINDKEEITKYGCEISVKNAKLLLDCITNLQEDYEKEHYLVDKLTRQLNDEYKNTEYQCKQKEDYKSRNEKALDKLYCYGEVFDSKILQQFQKEMKNILQGEDKDE